MKNIWSETLFPAKLMGTKIIFNEFIAFMQLAKGQTMLSEKSRLIRLYALCGFANFASAGIIIGGLTSLLPVACDIKI